MSRRKRARLLLEDGAKFEGWSFGASKGIEGEVVFTTGMSGYPQSLTDPSYFGQIFVNTYPLVGNYGVPDDAVDDNGIPLHFESDRIWASGLVAAEVSAVPSHYESVRSLPAWMEVQGVPGIEGIDTRALTMRLREKGVMRGSILVEGPHGSWPEPEPAASAHAVASVSRREAAVYGAGGFPRIAFLDCGAKNNILRCFLARGTELTVLPWNASLDGLDYDGIFLSNGPGNPKACTKTIATIRRALAGDKPVFGICLGAQIMRPRRRRGHLQAPLRPPRPKPALRRRDDAALLCHEPKPRLRRPRGKPPRGLGAVVHECNDDTVEGIRSTRGPFFSVQFHPEACPGPRDTEFLFDAFLAQAKERAGRGAAVSAAAASVAATAAVHAPAEVREVGLARESGLATGLAR